jgi:uncharacterized protein YjiS (DUF1127 family)
MATITHDPHPDHPVLERLAAPFRLLSLALRVERAVPSHLSTLHALEAKTDAELSGMGLTRDDLPRHAFRDVMGF